MYGATSFEECFETLKTKYPGIALTCMQTNHECVLIDQLHHFGFEKNTGIILNAGGLSHTSISLRDAVASIVYLDYSRKEGEWEPNKFGGREYLEAIDFLKAMNETVYKYHPDIINIAEESTDFPGVSRPTYSGGMGFVM